MTRSAMGMRIPVARIPASPCADRGVHGEDHDRAPCGEARPYKPARLSTTHRTEAPVSQGHIVLAHVLAPVELADPVLREGALRASSHIPDGGFVAISPGDKRHTKRRAGGLERARAVLPVADARTAGPPDDRVGEQADELPAIALVGQELGCGAVHITVMAAGREPFKQHDADPGDRHPVVLVVAAGREAVRVETEEEVRAGRDVPVEALGVEPPDRLEALAVGAPGRIVRPRQVGDGDNVDLIYPAIARPVAGTRAVRRSARRWRAAGV